MQSELTQESSIKSRVHEVIFGYDSRAGRLFDIILICEIIASVTAVMLDSVADYHNRYGEFLYVLEWLFTVLFTAEYALRIYASPNPRHYIFSFYGLIDFLSIIPTYLAFLFPGSVYLIVIRILRVLRIFRILKLFRYIGEANILFNALINARRKILVFLFAIITLIVIFGTLMFLIEGPENGFSNIPQSMYWAIVTVTTVGYGDISPHTPLGQAIAALAMICGYAIIAVPTGIVGAEIMGEFQRHQREQRGDLQNCPACKLPDHDSDANYCKRCGAPLSEHK